ncbi:MAG: iron uptake porin [Cyanobacteria bacterium J06634_5]
MKNTFWKVLFTAPAVLGAAFVSSSAVAAESVTVEPAVVAEPIQLAQVTSVSELSDVQPGDWAFTALQRLVEEYGCLEGFPDRTYRGNRALTRYEFAAGLNACLDVVIQLIGEGSDLDEIRRLQEEFAAELATIRGRVDTLETDVAELEANQFSTTTKLRGVLESNLVVPFDDADLFIDDIESITPGTAATGDDGTVGGDEADATFEYRASLNFDTSFTGEDRLRIRLRAGDPAGALANTESGLASSGGGGAGDNVKLDDVYYSFPVGNRISGIIAANSVVTDDFVTSTIVPFDGPSVADAGGPEFYDLYDGGSAFGAGANIAFTNNLVLDLGYASDSANINSDDDGIFNNGSYIAQLNFLTDGILDAAVTYIGATDAGEGDADNTIAGLLNLDFGGFQVGGHYASTDVEGGGDLDSYMGGVSIADLFGTGNEFGVYGGVSPAVDRDPLLVEAYYQVNVNEFFTFTPAVIYADNDSDGDSTDNFYGALRATFKF